MRKRRRRRRKLPPLLVHRLDVEGTEDLE